MKVDITDKLNFDEKPLIQIKDTVIAVNNSAVNVLKIADLLSKKDNAIAEISDLLFEPAEKEKLVALKLDFADYMKVIFSAIELVGGETEGEAQTRTTI